MNKTKTVAIICIILGVLVIGGFVLLLTRKQSIDPSTGEVKTSWRKVKQPAEEKAEE
jgi:hypothetical protein